MGYYASGTGTAVLKKGVDMDAVLQVLDELPDNEIEVDERDSYIEFCDYYWDEEHISAFLQALTPFISKGCVNYSGEDNSNWRYVYRPESASWAEEDAKIVYGFESYTDKELILELTKRGYKVNK